MSTVDPGPVPYILKREPPKQEPPLPKPVTDYGDLSAADLAKQINDDYSVILNSERANLPRALAIAEKLNALRLRAVRGEWKNKFSSYGLKISYETASVYLRIWEHWDDIRTLAAQKGVDPTLLTIDAARELWARRNDDDATGDAEDTEASDAGDDAGAEPDEETEEKAVGKKWLEMLAPDDLIFWLKEVHGVEYLKELAKALAKVLTPPPPPKVDPLAIPPALQRTVPATQAPASSVSGVQRRY